MALAWVLRLPEINSALIGVNTSSSCREPRLSAESGIQPQQLEAIDREVGAG
jgi:aryl-alcohol dehydrogenase-like predicted oxidoreductase